MKTESDSERPGPMSAERLAELRAEVTAPMTAYNQDVYNKQVAELLADRDHHYQRAEKAEAEAKGWRDRCHVMPIDVEAAGVTRAQCRLWLLSLPGFSVPDWTVDDGGMVEDGLVVVWTDDGSGDTDTIFFDAGGAESIASVIRETHCYVGDGDIAQLDILDAMAAIEVAP